MLDSTEKAHSEDKHIVIMGDLNYDYNVNENVLTHPIHKIEKLFSLRQLIVTPTRVTSISATILDIILTSCHE